jgi:RNA polymerase sigma-70 factor, ECF subfamily
MHPASSLRQPGAIAASLYPGSDPFAPRERMPSDVARDIRDLADEDLLLLVRRGEADAFAVVYERHASSVYSLAYRMMGSRPAAEDVTQEAFISAWRSAARYDQRRGSVRTWLLGVAHHRAIDAMRRGRVRDLPRAADEDAAERLESGERTDVEAARREEAGTVRAALATLPGEQSRVIELAYFGGFSQTEIAEMVQVPLGTVKGRMRLGLMKLRAELGQGAVMPA